MYRCTTLADGRRCAGWGSTVTDMLRRSAAAGALLYIRYTSALEAPAGGCGAVRVVVARGCINLRRAFSFPASRWLPVPFRCVACSAVCIATVLHVRCPLSGRPNRGAHGHARHRPNTPEHSRPPAISVHTVQYSRVYWEIPQRIPSLRPN